MRVHTRCGGMEMMKNVICHAHKHTRLSTYLECLSPRSHGTVLQLGWGAGVEIEELPPPTVPARRSIRTVHWQPGMPV
jgi:hypothetical protein